MKQVDTVPVQITVPTMSRAKQGSSGRGNAGLKQVAPAPVI
jgi:hypothetical protein